MTTGQETAYINYLEAQASSFRELARDKQGQGLDSIANYFKGRADSTVESLQYFKHIRARS